MKAMSNSVLAQPAVPATVPPVQSGWRRYASIYAALWRNSLIREMGFQLNFLLWLFVELLWFALQLGFNSIIYLHTDTIGEWTKWEVVMLIGASHFTQQIFQTFFLVNCAQLSELVHAGKMDFMLLFPVNTRFLLSARHVDLGGLFGAASGLAVVVYAAQKLGVTPTALQVAGFLALSAAAILVHYSLMFLMATMRMTEKPEKPPCECTRKDLRSPGWNGCLDFPSSLDESLPDFNQVGPFTLCCGAFSRPTHSQSCTLNPNRQPSARCLPFAMPSVWPFRSCFIPAVTPSRKRNRVGPPHPSKSDRRTGRSS